MTVINATNLDHKTINELIRAAEPSCVIRGLLGQRFIATGLADKEIVVEGASGNALGAYLYGAKIDVRGNAQDAVGDTMNDGEIIVRGNIGDAAGYAMRGGRIFVQGNAGYRAGVHMKEYRDKSPLLMIGGRAGSFLGEYQAGGAVVVLGLGVQSGKIIGEFPCAGMHGGKTYLRSDCQGIRFPDQVAARPVSEEERRELETYVAEFCRIFEYDFQEVMNAPFTIATPDDSNPYRRMYAPN